MSLWNGRSKYKKKNIKVLGGFLREQIRKSVFETNSSSTHSLTMCSEASYDKWKNGEILINKYDGGFTTKEKIIEQAKKRKQEYEAKKEAGEKLWRTCEKYIEATTDEELFELEKEDDYATWDEYWDWAEESYSTFEEEYEIEDGKKVIAFGYYGYDG